MKTSINRDWGDVDGRMTNTLTLSTGITLRPSQDVANGSLRQGRQGGKNDAGKNDAFVTIIQEHAYILIRPALFRPNDIADTLSLDIETLKELYKYPETRHGLIQAPSTATNEDHAPAPPTNEAHAVDAVLSGRLGPGEVVDGLLADLSKDTAR